VLAGGVALVASITVLRFCGGLSIPPKPAPSFPTGSQSQLLTKSAGSRPVYEEYLAKDAASAGVRTPTSADMQRKFPYRVDEARHVLEVGQPAIDLAGVRLGLVRENANLVLEITNTTESDLAYSVLSEPTPNISECSAARPLSFNALVVAAGKTERRVECVFRNDMAVAITRVESMEIPPLSAYLLSLVSPTQFSMEPRIARGHRGVQAGEKCSSVVSQAVRSGLEKGQIGWRDLADFYARHRCLSYRFPLSYRAVKSDDERTVPAVESGM